MPHDRVVSAVTAPIRLGRNIRRNVKDAVNHEVTFRVQIPSAAVVGFEKEGYDEFRVSRKGVKHKRVITKRPPDLEQVGRNLHDIADVIVDEALGFPGSALDAIRDGFILAAVKADRARR